MFRTILSLVLVGLLGLGLAPARTLAAQRMDEAQAVQKVKQKLAKIGVGEGARVTVRKRDGSKIKGIVTETRGDDFTVRDRTTGAATTILYTDVAKVEDNRGHSTLRNVLLGVGIGVGGLLAVLFAVFAAIED